MEDVAQKLSPLHPFQFWNSRGYGRLNFSATPSKFWSMIDFFIGHQMRFYSTFCISKRKAEIWEKLLFPFLSRPQVVKNHDYNYHLGVTLKKEKQFFSKLSFSVTDSKNWLKYYLMAYIISIIDKHCGGLAENSSLPCPFKFQNWNGHIGLNSWATPFKFCENSYILEI